MKTLDDVLTELVMARTSPLLAELEKDDWSEETGEEKLATLRQIEEEILDGAVAVVENLLKTELENENALKTFFRMEMLNAELDTLMTFRAKLDYTPNEEDYPFSYEWLTPKIRERIAELQKCSQALESVLEPNVTEEL